jgi:hypothetical protein
MKQDFVIDSAWGESSEDLGYFPIFKETYKVKTLLYNWKFELGISNRCAR